MSAAVGELAKENVLMRKVESMLRRRKKRALVEVGELIGENMSIRRMESGSKHVKEEEESDSRNRKVH